MHCLKASRGREGAFATVSVAGRPFQGLVSLVMWPRRTTAGKPGFVPAGASAGTDVLCVTNVGRSNFRCVI